MSSSVEETVAALLTRVDELSDFCARLSRENEELQRRVTATVVRGPSSARDDEAARPWTRQTAGWTGGPSGSCSG